MGYNCAYIRLSEEDKNKSKNYSESILNQCELIDEYAKQNHIHINKKYIDDGYSGINFERPAFEQLVKDIEDNNIDTIITKDFSRLGREFIETCYYITRYFPKKNIRYIAINENYDSFQKDNEAKEMLVGIKGIINDKYIKETSKKIKSVKEQKTEEGYYMGFIAPYGYKKVRDIDGKITLEIDNEVQDIIKNIFQRILDGETREEVANYLNEMRILTPMEYMKMTKSRGKNYYDKWTSGIIYRIVRNITYTGNLYKRKSSKKDYRQKKRNYIRINDREIISDTHPAIIDLDTFERANSMLKTFTKTNRLKDYNGILDGLVICGECGKTLNVSGRKKENGRIIYQFYCTDGKNRNKECNNTNILYTNKLENIVIEYINREIESISDENVINAANKYISSKRKIKERIYILKKEIEIKKANIKNLYLQKVKEQITTEIFIEQRNIINKQVESKEKEILKLEENLKEEIQKEEIIRQYERFKSDNNLMKYIKNFVKYIKFYKNKKIEIMLDFKGIRLSK